MLWSCLGWRHGAAWALFGLGLALAPARTARAQGAELRVPRGGGVTIDARITPGEWNGAAVTALSDGSELRLQHDGTYLYLALRVAQRGFPSVCVARGDVTHVLHASAALGHAVYARAGDAWALRTPFAFALRTRETTDAARAERDAYLRTHGWLATTMYMGDGAQKEMQIPLAFLDPDAPYLALAYMRDAPAARGPSAFLPLRLRDGCADAQLVRGLAPARLRFEPAGWMRLRLE